MDYTYDAVGNLKTEQGPFGTVTYSYDAANQVTRINQPNGANQDFAYTDGKVKTAWLPGNIVQTLSYDNAGRQTGIKAVKNGVTTLTDYTGTYISSANKDTELLQKEINNINTGTYTYSYDGLDRLTDAAGSNGATTWGYTYDANGNRVGSAMNNNPATSFNVTYNAANQANGEYFDQAGNQNSNFSGLSMNYNYKNQTTYFYTAGASVSQNASYADSGQTGRAQIGITNQLNGNLGLYSDTTGPVTTYYTHMPTGTQQTTGQTVNGTYYYYLTDLHGSTVKMVDGSGSVINTYDYDPYGKQISGTGSVSNTIRYANGYFDSYSSLYKYGERYYDPNEGRWTQLVPSGQDKGYLYAGDNPVNFSDPSGLLSGYQIYLQTLGGCGSGFVGAYGLAGATAVATGGHIEISAIELGFACAVGGSAAFYEAIGNPGASAAVQVFDFLSHCRDFNLICMMKVE